MNGKSQTNLNEHFAFLSSLDEAGSSRYFFCNLLGVVKTGHDSGLTWEQLQEQLPVDTIKYFFESSKWIWERHPFSRMTPAAEGEVFGLYVGSMDPAVVRNGVAQALMYCDRVYIIDPFSVSLARGGDFNPIEVPERYLFDAILSIQEIMALAPFIAEDLVRVVTVPDLFDPDLFLRMRRLAEERLAKNPLKREDLVEWDSHVTPNFVRWLGTWSDADLYEYRKAYFGDDRKTARRLIRGLRKLVRKDPRRINVRAPISQVFRTHTSGLNTEMSIFAANQLQAFPFTNWQRAWRELNGYHGEISSYPAGWIVIEQCLQKLEFPDFGSIAPGFLLQIRQDARFQALRHALRELWKAIKQPEFHDSMLKDLTGRLEVEVAKIKTQLDGINNDYRRWLVAAGAATAASVAAMGISGDLKLGAILLASFAASYARAGERSSKIANLARQSSLSVYFKTLR